MEQTFSDRDLWIVILGLAVGSFALRFAFLGVVGGRAMPEWLLRHLRYSAVSIIPALVVPLVLWPAANAGEPDPVRLAAAAATFVISYWRKNVLLGILAGGLTLTGLSLLIG